MGIRFDIRVRGIDRLGLRMAHASEKAKHAVAIQAAKDTEPFVPALTKSLANSTRVEGDTILYPGPYAHYLYIGKLFIDPNTGSAFVPLGASSNPDTRTFTVGTSASVRRSRAAAWRWSGS